MNIYFDTTEQKLQRKSSDICRTNQCIRITPLRYKKSFNSEMMMLKIVKLKK